MLLWVGAGQAAAQIATFSGGSIYDLDPLARQSTQHPLFEQIIKKQNLEPVSSIAKGDVLRELARPVGRLSIELADQKVSYCTASIIDTDLILTNYHCVPGLGAQRVKALMLWMGYLRPRDRTGVAQYRVEREPVEADKAMDFAILRVQGTPGNEWGRIVFSDRVPADNGSLFLIHHPAGQYQRISRGGCSAAKPAAQGDDLLHECDTLPGSSGAPIFDNNSRRVVGLHYGAIPVSNLNSGKLVASLARRSSNVARLLAAAPAYADASGLSAFKKELIDLMQAMQRNKRDDAGIAAPPQSSQHALLSRPASRPPAANVAAADRAYREAVSDGSEARLREFVSTYPSHPKAADLKLMLDERSNWRSAEGADTRDGYERYLMAYPSGLYAIAARERLASLTRRDMQSRATPVPQRLPPPAYGSYPGAGASASLAPPAPPAPPQTGSFAPSFDCEDDDGVAEQAICRNRLLSRLDVELSNMFVAVRAALDKGRRITLRDSQRNWLKLRNACGANEVCLHGVYVRRIQELRAWGG